MKKQNINKKVIVCSYYVVNGMTNMIEINERSRCDFSKLENMECKKFRFTIFLVSKSGVVILILDFEIDFLMT